jgi:hypothetical protein
MKLLFIYNADSGKLNALFDIGHKIVNPESYSCNLCTLTHGTFAERKEWKRFRESTSLDLLFLHRDEFETQFEQRFSYPIVLKQEEAELEVFVSTEQLNSVSDPAKLIELITERAS